MGNMYHGSAGSGGSHNADMADQEARLQGIVNALREKGMQSGSSYYAGYSSINPSSQLVRNTDGLSLA